MDPTHFPSRRFPSIPPPNPPPPADLPAAISHLKSLLSSASSTLASLPFPSSPLHPPPLLACPYNPYHLLPPESLYRHFLNCPSPLPSLPSVSPPNPETETQQDQTSFPPTCSDSDSDTDFIFSLESENGDLGSGFFYKDCPGVVSSVPDPAKSFTLPGFLLSDHTSENDAISGKFTTILSSEYWVLRSEVEAWQYFPVSYSYMTLVAILGLNTVSEGHLKKWVISNSPKFGIIIDVAVRDHIWFLLKLCLKAVRREAVCSLDALLRNDVAFDSSFLISCPKLTGSFSWLSNQLSILYGGVHARSFSLGMIKEAIIRSGFCIMMSNFEGKDGEIDKRESCEVANEGACNGNVLVSQVACAIGALHRRAFLEQNIRALRSTQPVSKLHLLMEHAYLSSRAADERSKRPNYRPISDYDGLPSRVQNQGSGRAKTKEELLAEERDYKRRRTSYRGKKLKRSPTEVLRDIIDEHMEVLKQAGGIGSSQTSTGHASSKPDNSQKSTTSNTYPFQNPPSPSYEKSYKRGSRCEREDSADTYYSRSYKDFDERCMGKERRRDGTDYYSSRSYSEHEDRHRSKEKGKEHHSRRSDSVFQDTFDDRYDAHEDREEKRRHRRYDRSR